MLFVRAPPPLTFGWKGTIHVFPCLRLCATPWSLKPRKCGLCTLPWTLMTTSSLSLSLSVLPYPKLTCRRGCSCASLLPSDCLCALSTTGSRALPRMNRESSFSLLYLTGLWIGARLRLGTRGTSRNLLRWLRSTRSLICRTELGQSYHFVIPNCE